MWPVIVFLGKINSHCVLTIIAKSCGNINIAITLFHHNLSNTIVTLLRFYDIAELLAQPYLSKLRTTDNVQ